MKGLKDFFHATNDIALAIIVVILAAGIIAWRLAIILQYPAQVAKEAASSQSNQTEQADDSSSSKTSK